MRKIPCCIIVFTSASLIRLKDPCGAAMTIRTTQNDGRTLMHAGSVAFSVATDAAGALVVSLHFILTCRRGGVERVVDGAWMFFFSGECGADCDDE